MLGHTSFAIQRSNVWIVPSLHYSMESAACVCEAFHQISPDCVAVELAETLQSQFLAAASRLPDISVITSLNQSNIPYYYLCEPCDPAFEGLRSALENGRDAYCIDLDVDYYPDIHEPLPDSYSIARIGLEAYWKAYQEFGNTHVNVIDQDREEHMARRLKELSLRYERVLCVCGMAHAQRIADLLANDRFNLLQHASKTHVELSTLSDQSCREILPEGAYLRVAYEEAREQFISLIGSYSFPPDRRQLLFMLYKAAGIPYTEKMGGKFPHYHLRNLMKFTRHYALITNRLTPTFFQLITAAKGCVDSNYAYEVWKLATDYPYLKNIDNLPVKSISVEDFWGGSQKIKFKLLDKNKKGSFQQRLQKDSRRYRLIPSSKTGICSYQPEDKAIESFGAYLKKKSVQILTNESARAVPFSTSLEEGIDTRETIRHWLEKKIYVRQKTKLASEAGSVVIIFDEDKPEEGTPYLEKYPWCTTWHGEHTQESDMAFYATPMTENLIGPGIFRCEYGGMMLTYPPRRVLDVWMDPDYADCQSKSEVLLKSAIDYSTSPNIIYVAASPPRPLLKSYAARYGKKVIYLPISQLSPVTLHRLRRFHVLDGHDKRTIADEYIFE